MSEVPSQKVNDGKRAHLPLVAMAALSTNVFEAQPAQYIAHQSSCHRNSAETVSADCVIGKGKR